MAEIHPVLYKIIAETTEDPGFLADLPEAYEKRLVAQKIIYLLQARFGMKERWRFNWYIAGPYSPALASDLYAIAGDFSEVARQAQATEFNNDARGRIDDVKALLRAAPTGLPRHRWLELLASVDYVAKWKNKDLTDESLVDLVQAEKPLFERAEIEAAIEALRRTPRPPS